MIDHISQNLASILFMSMYLCPCSYYRSDMNTMFTKSFEMCVFVIYKSDILWARSCYLNIYRQQKNK